MIGFALLVAFLGLALLLGMSGLLLYIGFAKVGESAWKRPALLLAIGIVLTAASGLYLLHEVGSCNDLVMC